MDNMTEYSLPDVLQQLRGDGGERLQMEVGLPPWLVIKRNDYEIEGPTDSAAVRFARSRS